MEGTCHPPRLSCGSCAHSRIPDLQAARGSSSEVLVRVAALPPRVPPSATVRGQFVHVSQ